MVHVILGEFSSFQTFNLWEIKYRKRVPKDAENREEKKCLQTIINTTNYAYLKKSQT